MHYARLAVLTVSVGVVFASAQPTTTRSQANIAAGKELFHQRCSVCHGMDAKGNGSMYDPESADESKRVPPADLTVLSEHNEGKFPAERIRDAVYGQGLIPAHGTPNMPGWGNVFDNLKSNPKRLQEDLRNLTGYIESIQEPKK